MPVDIIRAESISAAGFAHGFSLRTGGVSAAPFDSLNLGRALGDDADAVEENHRRFGEAVGYGRVYEVSQVHGARVRDVSPTEDPRRVRAEEADAVMTRGALAVGIRVADCAPLLIADPVSGDVAAVHAGWRGTEAGVVAAAIAALGHPPERLLVALGPHIRVAHFEVGEDVAARLQALAPEADVVDRSFAKPHVDLAGVLRAQLRRLGVKHIEDVGGCTHADAARFFSYRRDGAGSGRHLAAIVGRS